MRIFQTHSDLVNDAGLISIKQVFSNRILVNDVVYEMNEGIFPPYRILGILLKKFLQMLSKFGKRDEWLVYC